MQLPEPPKIAAVEVVPAQPTEADRAAIAHMGLKQPKAVYLVKVRLKAKLPVTSMASALYGGDERVSKYWEYKDRIYFVVFEPPVLRRAQGQTLTPLAERHRLLRHRCGARAGPVHRRGQRDATAGRCAELGYAAGRST